MQAVPPSATATTVRVLHARLRSRLGPHAAYTRPGVTRLCIDGPPRSANSLLCHKLRLAGGLPPGHRARLAHHTHEVDSVELAILLKVPVIMPLRDPLAALCSLHVYRGGRNMAGALALYLHMCGLALTHRRQVLVAPFDTTVGNVNAVFQQANDRFGLHLPMLPMSNEEANALIAEEVRQSNRHGALSEARIGVPDERREAAKRQVRATIEAMPQYARCRTVYDRLMKVATAA